MKTFLRLIKRGEWKELPNPNGMIPSKGDSVVFEEKGYIVSYLEFDYDSNILYICSL